MLERHQAARHRAVDVLQRCLDAAARIDDHREQRQVRGDVGESLGVDAAIDPESLDPAQQGRGRDPAPFEPPHELLARQSRARGDRLAEVDGELERVRDHPSAPPSSQPAPVAARPATIEPNR